MAEDGTVEQELRELPHQQIPVDFAPKVDFSALEARLKARLEEQLEMMQKHEELREKLKTIADACAEEDEARVQLEQSIKEQAEELESAVTTACEPVAQLRDRQAEAADALMGVAAAETALRATLEESNAIARPAVDRVAAAGRQVEEWQQRCVELGQEVIAQAAQADDVGSRTETLAALITAETAAAEALRQQLLEKQRALYEAAPPRASDQARILEEEVFACQQRGMQRAERLLGYLLKVSGKLAAGERDHVAPRSTDGAAWRRDLTAGFGAMYRASETRELKLTLLRWRLQVYGTRRLRRVQKALLNAVPPAEEVLPPLAVNERLEGLAKRTEWLEESKLSRSLYDERCRDHESALNALRAQLPPCLNALERHDLTDRLGQDLIHIETQVAGHAADLSALEQRAGAAIDQLPHCASADDIQKLVGQVVAIWNDVKRADETKVGRPELDKVRESIQAVWADCAAEADQDAASLVTAATAQIEARIGACRTEVEANQAHFVQLEGMLSQLATFVEEMVSELHKLEHA